MLTQLMVLPRQQINFGFEPRVSLLPVITLRAVFYQRSATIFRPCSASVGLCCSSSISNLTSPNMNEKPLERFFYALGVVAKRFWQPKLADGIESEPVRFHRGPKQGSTSHEMPIDFLHFARDRERQSVPRLGHWNLFVASREPNYRPSLARQVSSESKKPWISPSSTF